MKYGLTIRIGLAAAAIITVVVFASNPLRRSEASIEASFLQITPLGSSIEEVQRALEKKGFRTQLTPTGVYKQKYPAGPEVVGTKSIIIRLGEYGPFFVTSVSGFWAFDRTGKLIDLWVWKTVDAP